MSRILAITHEGVLDSLTGEIEPRLSLVVLMRKEPGGFIAGDNLYSVLAPLAAEIKGDEGWTMSIAVEQKQGGKISIGRITYRHSKITKNGKRFRPPTVKWLVLDLGLFMDTFDINSKGIKLTDVISCAKSLIELAERRGIKPRPSPGSFGGALLRASECWHHGRKPSPRFISEIAREHLPGNYYEISHDFQRVKSIDHAYYLDQFSAHHRIASQIVLPHPHTLRARGNLRSVEREKPRAWLDDIAKINSHVGLLCVRVECPTLSPKQIHLYPPWTRQRGSHVRWIWTPELRLFGKGDGLFLRHIYCALTSKHLDPALWEYAEWSLQQREREDADRFKLCLLAAYGMLACRVDRPYPIHTVHGRAKPPRAKIVSLPLLPRVFRSEVQSMRTPSIQNVIARGVIEAETRTRSIEMARALEGEGVPVAQIYADGLLAVTDQLPLLLPSRPNDWRARMSLTNVRVPHPNAILSDQMTKLPGIPRSYRMGQPVEFSEPVREHIRAANARFIRHLGGI